MLIGECEITADRDELALEMPYHASLLAKVLAIIFLGYINFFTGYLVFTGQFIQRYFPLTLLSFLFLILHLILIIGSWLNLIFSFLGREKVIITFRNIHIEHGAFGYWFSKRCYSVREIKGLFISKTFDESFGRRDMNDGYRRGRIGFNIGKSLFGSWITIRFGSCLDRQQAREVLHLIFEHFPQYRPEKARSSHA